ncbi:MAG: glycerol-3-phosphate 1-O-acyltransferase PlsY [Thermodesulfobacteriota bacterium]
MDPHLKSYFLIFIPAAYLLGSIPFGIVVARLFGGGDPRKAGSGNIGATNVGRSVGRAAGVLTLVLDLLKGAVPVLLAVGFFPDAAFVSLVGLAAFLGHLFPLYLGFRGGKGVATAFGVMLAVSFPVAVLCAVVFAVVVAFKRYVSLGSIIAAGLLPVFLSFMPRYKAFVPLGAAIAVLVIIKHKENIRRLAQGRENRVGGKKG